MYINIKNNLENIETTKDIIIPKDPLERVIGHEDIIQLVKIAAKQRRNLLLVGPRELENLLLLRPFLFI